MTHPVTSLKIRRPDDWHIHFRDGAMLGTVVPFTSEFFGRAIVMPNLVPPVTTTWRVRYPQYLSGAGDDVPQWYAVAGTR